MCFVNLSILDLRNTHLNINLGLLCAHFVFASMVDFYGISFVRDQCGSLFTWDNALKKKKKHISVVECAGLASLANF